MESTPRVGQATLGQGYRDGGESAWHALGGGLNGRGKDTSVCRLTGIRWPGSSARGRRPDTWAGRGSHDAQSVRKEHNLY